ncbi:hypothetical protein MBORA_00080 [Methanobrevibacter oralis]|uniref:Uncharacterized protein n=1 Tax=Methanobrevibacter oralis TaxID=66851 RepID=A0A166CDP9_METOA|nr:hypothetical protein MBORA_00080 [Methanobrevibacter oralis]
MIFKVFVCFSKLVGFIISMLYVPMAIFLFNLATPFASVVSEYFLSPIFNVMWVLASGVPSTFSKVVW